MVHKLGQCGIQLHSVGACYIHKKYFQESLFGFNHFLKNLPLKFTH